MKYVIYGTGGFAREVAWITDSFPPIKSNLLGFVDDDPAKHGLVINSLPVLGGHDWLVSNSGSLGVFIAVGDPEARHRVATRIRKIEHLHFPSLVHPSVQMGPEVELGLGTIICAGSILTCNIQIAPFAIINLHCTVGHDARIGAFSTLAPGVHVSGQVSIGVGANLGTGASMIQGLTIGAHTVLGAGAVANRDIPPGTTAVGVPAKVIKSHPIPDWDNLSVSPN